MRIIGQVGNHIESMEGAGVLAFFVGLDVVVLDVVKQATSGVVNVIVTYLFVRLD